MRIAESVAERENKLFIGMLPKTYTLYLTKIDGKKGYIDRGYFKKLSKINCMPSIDGISLKNRRFVKIALDEKTFFLTYLL